MTTTVEVTEVRNVITVSPVTNEVTVNAVSNVITHETGGSVFNGVVHTIGGTDHDLTGDLPLDLNPAVAGLLLTGTVGAEANPRLRIQTDRIELRTGGAATTGMDMRRFSIGQIDFVRDSSSAPQLRGRIETDTQPRWRITGGTSGGYEVGLGGSTVADTGFLRNTDPGRLRVKDYLELSNLVTKPTPTPAVGAGGEVPIFFYARGETSFQSKPYFQLESGTEVGPIGFLRGILGALSFPFGGFTINNPNGVTGLGGVSFWGHLAVPTHYGTNTADAAYSPTVTLTNTINATEDVFYTSVGMPIFAGDIIVIDSERILATSVGGASLSCVRGVQGTTAVGHTAGAAISRAGVTTGTQTRFSYDGGPKIEQDTGAVISTDAGLEWPLMFFIHDNPLLVYQFHMYDITNQRIFIGFTDQTLATMNASDDPPGHYAGLQFSTARGDTAFKFVTKNGITQNVIDAVQVPAGAGTATEGPHFYLKIDVSGGPISFQLYDEPWSLLADVTTSTNVPGQYVPHRLVAGVRNLTATSKRFQHRFGSFMVSPSA